MTCLSSPQVLKYYSTMAEAVARRLEQLMSQAGLRNGYDYDGGVLLGQLRGGREPRLARAEHDVTLLHHACHHGWLDFVKSLIHEHSCVPHAVTQYQEETPLHCACQYGHFDIVRYLISEQHCYPDCCDYAHQTPLHLACRYGHFDIVRYLISEQHCDPDCCDCAQLTPLHWLSGAFGECTQEEAVKIVKFLLSLSNCDVSKRDENGYTALHFSCRDSRAGEMVIHCLHTVVMCLWYA